MGSKDQFESQNDDRGSDKESFSSEDTDSESGSESGESGESFNSSFFNLSTGSLFHIVCDSLQHWMRKRLNAVDMKKLTK